MKIGHDAFLIVLIVFITLKCNKCNTGKLSNKNSKNDSVGHLIETNLLKDEIGKLWFMQVPTSDSNLLPFKFGERHSFRVPSNWKIIKNSNYIFLASLKSSNNNEYIVVIEQSKSKNGLMGISDYNSFVYNQMMTDSNELILNSEQYELKFVNKPSAIMGEFDTYLLNEKYKIFTCYFEDDEYIYDITMKRSLKSFKPYEILDFINFIRNLRIDKIQKISLSNLSSIIKIAPPLLEQIKRE